MVEDTLREVFGFDSLLPGQEEVIGHLLKGRSAAAIFPTGGGKSLCYQLPALHLEGLTLVISPLIALMKDQLDQLQKRGVAAARLDSTLTADEHREVMAALREGRLKILYTAPERFNNERFREMLKDMRIALLAVDEAHCISEWGHNFRPDYLKLAEIGREYEAERILALTATAPPYVLDDICRGFGISKECAVRTGFYRPNLRLLLTPTAREERDNNLLTRLQEHPPGPTIVYVTLQKTAERLADFLTSQGYFAYPYHAGLKNEERDKIQDAFMASKTGIVVATIAFGMGVDKADIRYVYHYNMAKSLENLSQEIGRAGRDGEESICESLVCLDDVRTLENFVYGDTPSREALLEFLRDLFSPTTDTESWSLYELSARHDIRQLVVRTMLTYLELDGYLRAGTPIYTSYQFKPLMSSEEMLERFNPERQRFLRDLFRQAKKARVWFNLDVDQASRTLRTPRERLIRALDYLEEQKMMELRVGGVRHSYRYLQRPEDLEALADELYERSLEREEREVERIQQVLELVGAEGCQTAALCNYFGEEMTAACGHCTFCLGGEAVDLEPPTQPVIDEEIWAQAEALRKDEREVLGEPRALARFLAGLSSPRASRRRLGSHKLFGSCADVPFAEILAQAEGST